jgi:lysozyme
VPSRGEVIATLTIFTNALVHRYGKRPVYYVTPAFFDAYMKDNRWRFPPHLLWIRSIFLKPSFRPCEDEKEFNEDGWTFWQYASRGRIAGVNSIVDLNAFCGDQRAFGKLLVKAALENFQPPSVSSAPPAGPVSPRHSAVIS